jgi:hypothetical protein
MKNMESRSHWLTHQDWECVDMRVLLTHLIKMDKIVSNVTLHGIKLQSADLILDRMFWIRPQIAYSIARLCYI